jgi:hypothetical protein
MRFLSTKVHQRCERVGWEVNFQPEDWNEKRHKSDMLTLALDGGTVFCACVRIERTLEL